MSSRSATARRRYHASVLARSPVCQCGALATAAVRVFPATVDAELRDDPLFGRGLCARCAVEWSAAKGHSPEDRHALASAALLLRLFGPGSHWYENADLDPECTTSEDSPQAPCRPRPAEHGSPEGLRPTREHTSGAPEGRGVGMTSTFR